MKNYLSILLCTCFVLTTTAQNSIDLYLENNFLNFPVSFEEEDDTRLEVVIDGEVIREFDIFLPDSDPDFWVFLDISAFKGKKAALRTLTGEEKKGLELIYQSDDRKYLENVYQEEHRPQLHFSTMRGWINDPNGLIYYDGEYHLFYQHNPYGTGWGNMHWGHAVSKDLLHWEQLEEALYPDEVGVAFSGSCVIDYENTSGFKTGDEDVMVAIYTSSFFPSDKEMEQGMEYRERTSLAFSNDRGRTWTKYEGNPIISNRQEYLKSGNNRDPNVFWHEPTQKWVMAIFERIGITIFTSENLKDWKEESHFEMFWECPELFELPVDGDPKNTKWVAYGAGGYYALGSFDGKEFDMESGLHTYYVGDQFASQLFENIPETDGRQIQVGWGVIETPEMPFNMMMLFPTELTLRSTNDGIRLFNEPIEEIRKLHKNSYSFKNINFPEANEKVKDINSELLHIKCEVELTSAIGHGFNFGGDELFYTIRTNDFILNDEEKVYRYNPELGSNIMKYEIILDRTTIEVFIDDGRFTMILPRNKETEDYFLEFGPLEDDDFVKFRHLEIHEMKSIWE